MASNNETADTGLSHGPRIEAKKVPLPSSNNSFVKRKRLAYETFEIETVFFMKAMIFSFIGRPACDVLGATA